MYILEINFIYSSTNIDSLYFLYFSYFFAFHSIILAKCIPLKNVFENVASSKLCILREFHISCKHCNNLDAFEIGNDATMH